MQPQKALGRTIIAAARSLSEIFRRMLHQNQPIDGRRTKNPELRRKAKSMQAAALDVA